jgi:phosphoserine phosphatase
MSEVLALWNDGPARAAILDFVKQVTSEGGPACVDPPDRVAVFDNDGTLWCEQPMPAQLDFILRRWIEMAAADPALREQQPWKAAVEGDSAWLAGALARHYQGDEDDMAVVLKGVLAAFEGITVEDFAERAGTFLRTQSHPSLKRLYRDCVYAPMVELLNYLKANRFTNLIASGGGRDFMRPITEEIYGVPPDRVVGSSVSLSFREDGDGGELVTMPHLDVMDDGPVKPTRIWSRLGKRPILAAGNSNGDVPMLRFANRPPRPALRLLVLHDDAEREIDYVSGADIALEKAKEYGWTVVSIKNDWKTVFA